MFRKILVGLDLDETCDVIFKKAVALAQATGADLLLLNALSPDEKRAPIPLPHHRTVAIEKAWPVYQERYRAYALRELERLGSFAERANAARVNTDFVQALGRPGWALCEQAKGCSADLVAVGSHGRMGLSEMRLGSVSNYVMHHAPCSVLIFHISGNQSKNISAIPQRS